LHLTEKAEKSENVLGAEYSKDKFPDKNPSVVKFLDNSIPQNDVAVGVLVSLDINVKSFCKMLNTIF